MTPAQEFHFLRGDEVISRILPPPQSDVIPGVRWGQVDCLFTAAFWVAVYWECGDESATAMRHRLGATLREEVGACLLGGYGIPAEIGLAAFRRIRDRGLLKSPNPGAQAFHDALFEPLILGGRAIRYRFHRQKARYLAAAFEALDRHAPPESDAPALRAYLLAIPGIGHKTASWIVRNWLGSSVVAILDIHVVRAGLLMGLFTPEDRVEQHYLAMEERFLALARGLGVPAADLDALMWQKMRETPRLIVRCLDEL